MKILIHIISSSNNKYYCKNNLFKPYQLSFMRYLNLKYSIAALAILCCLSIQKVKAQVNTQDSLALVDLYDSTGGANWTNHTNWLTGAPVNTWYGVNVISGGVNVVHLPSNNLTGSIPASIGQLNNLQELFLDSNHIAGIIPTSIGNLSNLVVLWINSNQLTNSIPSDLSNLTKLQSLNLNINKLTGSIPSSLGSLSGRLQVLDLSQNKLTGSIPASLGNLSNVIELFLNFNQLTGSIPPSLGNLSNVKYLYLSSNQLSNTIPSTLSNLTKLIWLNLGFNKLTGTLPIWISALPNLNGLALGSNQFTGSIPTSFGNFKRLTLLNLDINKLSGSKPTELGNVTSLTQIALSYNQFTGSIPASLGNLKSLQYLSLGNNQLSGTIPASLGNLVNMTSLFLSNNNFTFDGMELIATKFPFAVYAPQAPIPLYSVTLLGGSDETFLHVSVGGTPASNTYKWFNDKGVVATISKDSSYEPLLSNYYYVQVTDSLVPGLTLHSDTVNVQTTVPIKAINLQAEANSELVLLKWQTINEISTASFIIQHSTYGITFSDINTKTAVGKGDNSYGLIDKYPTNGINYYRLRSIDKDGSFAYSKVVFVQLIVNSNRLTVFPNPSKEKITVRGNHIISVQVIDNLGRVIKNVSFKDASNPTLTLTEMPVGVYHLQVQTTDGKVSGVGFVKE